MAYQPFDTRNLQHLAVRATVATEFPKHGERQVLSALSDLCQWQAGHCLDAPYMIPTGLVLDAGILQGHQYFPEMVFRENAFS